MAGSSAHGGNGEGTTGVTPDVPTSRRSSPKTRVATASVMLFSPEIASKIWAVSLPGVRGCAEECWRRLLPCRLLPCRRRSCRDSLSNSSYDVAELEPELMRQRRDRPRLGLTSLRGHRLSLKSRLCPVRSLPVRSGRLPVRSGRLPVRSTSGPVRSTSGPVRSPSGPVDFRSGRSPVRSGRLPVRSISGPVRSISGPVRSTSGPVPGQPVRSRTGSVTRVRRLRGNAVTVTPLRVWLMPPFSLLPSMGGADGASVTTTIRGPGSPGGISTTIRGPGPPGGNSAVVAIIPSAGRRLGPWRTRGGHSCPLPGNRRSQGGPRRTRALPLLRSTLTRPRSGDRANATSPCNPFSLLAAKTTSACLDRLGPLIGGQCERHVMSARTFALVIHV